MDESVLLVPVPEVEAVVGAWRWRHDTAARYGIPAHVTVLYPFVPASMIDDTTLARVSEALSTHRSFTYALTSLQIFGDEVLYLAPEPVERFVELTTSLSRAFPDYPPYGGAYDEVVPHLTVAQGAAGADRDSAMADITHSLPVRSRAVEVHLMVGRNEGVGWQLRHRFHLSS